MLGLMQSARSSPSAAISRKTAERGYTLIEMAVVVMIIGLIVVVAIPNLRRAKVRADLLG
ncbi:MAG: prepilin-type N-terminal cleavage/methylation domain-containing protein, partial [Thermoanaerobaculales bacterium]